MTHPNLYSEHIHDYIYICTDFQVGLMSVSCHLCSAQVGLLLLLHFRLLTRDLALDEPSLQKGQLPLQLLPWNDNHVGPLDSIGLNWDSPVDLWSNHRMIEVIPKEGS